VSDSTGPVQPQIANRRLGEGQPLLGSVAIPGRQPANGGQPVQPEPDRVDRPPALGERAAENGLAAVAAQVPCRSRHRPATPVCNSRPGRQTSGSAWSPARGSTSSMPAWLAQLLGRAVPRLPAVLVEVMLSDLPPSPAAAATPDRFGIRLRRIEDVWRPEVSVGMQL
jgi:hypothetical protein